MDPFDDNTVISPLKRIPGDVPAAGSGRRALHVQSAREVGNAGYRLYLAYELAGHVAKCGIRQQRVHHPGDSPLDSDGPVEAEPDSIQRLGTEGVLAVKRDELTTRHRVRQQLVK